MRGAEEAVMHEEESLERRGSNGASVSLTAGAAPLQPSQAAQQRRKKPITRGRALGEILSELQQIHNERTQQYQELMQEHKALRIRQRVTSLWLAQMELLIEVTADLRRTCSKPGAAQATGAAIASAAITAEDPPGDAGGSKNVDATAEAALQHVSSSDGAVREDFLASCLEKVRALRLEGPGQQPGPRAEQGRGGSRTRGRAANGSADARGNGGGVGGNRIAGSSSGANTRKLRSHTSRETAVPTSNSTSSAAGTTAASHLRLGSGAGTACRADTPALPGWVEKLRRLESDEEQRMARLKDPAFMLSAFVRDFVQSTAIDLCHVRAKHPHSAEARVRLADWRDGLMAETVFMLATDPAAMMQSSITRLDTMQPYCDTPPTVEHWATVCREMHLVGQQEAEVVELLAQWKPVIAASTAHRDTLLTAHTALLSSTAPPPAEEVERVVAEVDRANAEILFKAGAFTLALWAELLQPGQCASIAIASYPYSSNLSSLEDGMRHLLETRDAPPPALLAPPQPPLSDYPMLPPQQQ